MVTVSDGAHEVRPKVVAHRGASRSFPENTPAAFRGAAALGADWVELDARRTRDRQVVVHHDPTVVGDDIPIALRNRSELPGSVCSLAEALAVCKQTEPPLGVNVELKSGRGEPGFDDGYWDRADAQWLSDVVLETVDEVMGTDGVRGPLLFTSFDIQAIDRLRVLELSASTGLLTIGHPDPEKVLQLARDHGHFSVNPVQSWVTREIVDRAHFLGIEVNVWTVNEPDRMRELVDWGVDGIITDIPDAARAVIDATS